MCQDLSGMLDGRVIGNCGADTAEILRNNTQAAIAQRWVCVYAYDIDSWKKQQKQY